MAEWVIDIGTVAQLLTLFAIAMLVPGQRRLAKSPMYLVGRWYAATIWKLYTGLTLAVACFLAYVALGNGRNPTVITVVAVAVIAGCGYAAYKRYKEGYVRAAVIQIGVSTSFFGYGGMLMGPTPTRMFAAALMLIGAVAAALAGFAPSVKKANGSSPRCV